jgi:hypothetical protein
MHGQILVRPALLSFFRDEDVAILWEDVLGGIPLKESDREPDRSKQRMIGIAAFLATLYFSPYSLLAVEIAPVKPQWVLTTHQAAPHIEPVGTGIDYRLEAAHLNLRLEHLNVQFVSIATSKNCCW